MKHHLKTLSVGVVFFVGQQVVMAQTKKPDSTKTKDIEGVVITAFGIKREEKSLSYAAQTVKAKDLNVTQSVDVKSAIAGKVAGVQINGQAGSKLGDTGKLRLRGAISLTSDEDPIYVLDGIVIDPATIDLDNVESVNVLKGPSATALYGQRAEFGVVILTLKKGVKNRINAELNSTVNVDVIARTMNYQNMYGQGYYGENSLVKFAFDPTSHPAEWSVFDGKYIKYDDSYAADESWGAKFDGRDYVPWYAFWKDSPYFGQTAKWEAQPNNIRDFYDKAITLKNTITVSGGTDTFTGRLSFTNLDQNGITPYTKLKRNYISSNFGLRFTEKLRFDAIINYTDGKIRGDIDDGYGNQTSGSFNQWFARDLDIKKMKELTDLETPNQYHASWNWWGPDIYTLGGYYVKPTFWFNPYFYMKYFDQNQYRKNLLISVVPQYKFNDKFSAQLSVSRNQNNNSSNYFLPYVISKNSSGREGGYMDYYNGFGLLERLTTEDNYEVRGNYKQKLGNFDLNAFIGGSIRQNHWKSLAAQMGVFDKTAGYLIIPDVYNFSNASIAPTPTSSELKKTVESAFGQVSVGYKNYLFLEGTIRRDVSSAFFNKHNSTLTGSLGTSVIVSNLMSKNNFLSFAKIRASIAQIPGDLDPSVVFPQFRTATKPINYNKIDNVVINTPTVYVDPNLVPPINTNMEVGMDLKFLNNRLGFSGTFYNETRKDEIIPITAPFSSGYQNILANSATVNRKGIELSLNGDVIRSEKGFNWNINLNFAKNKTIVKKVAPGLERIDGPGGTSAFGYVTVTHKAGLEWGQLRGSGYKRDANGNLVVNNDGLYITERDIYFGSVLPKFTGGIFNSISYKNISLTGSIDFQKGGKFFSLSEQFGNYSGLLEETAAVNDKGFNVRDAVANGGGVHVIGVKEDGSAFNGYIEAVDYFKQFQNNRLAEPYIHDASYIKLREVALSYTLDKDILGSSHITGITIGIVARNPWLIAVSKDNKHRMDPSEMSQTYGEDGQLPSTKGFGVNVKINF